MELKEIPTAKIKIASYNPLSRTADKGLIESIRKFGIIDPLILTLKLDLIDGHRRLAVSKLLKMKTVPCVLVNGTSQQIKDSLYLEVNQNSKRISGADQVEIYKKGGKIETRYLNPLLNLIDIAGVEIVDILLKNHQNPSNIYHAFLVTKRYCKNLKLDDRQIIVGISNKKLSYQIRKNIENLVAPKTLIKQIVGV